MRIISHIISLKFYLLGNGTLANISTPDEEPAVDIIILCYKVTGILEGKPAVLRKCARGPSTYNGTCVANSTFFIDGRSVSDRYGCMCAEDKCNGAPIFHFTYVSLFAIAVYVLQ